VKAAITLGAPIRQIASAFNIAPSTVRYHRDKEVRDLDDYRRRRKLPKEVLQRRRWLKALCEKRDNRTTNKRKMYPTASHLRAALMDKHNIDVSAQTVRRDLEAVGAAAMKREKQPVLLQSQIEKRQAFARDRHLPDAEKILFSENAYVYERDSGRVEWCFKGEQATPIGTERYVRKISLFGIIGIGVRKVRVVEEDSIDRFVYVDLLRKDVAFCCALPP
jgi:hypothetical protein